MAQATETRIITKRLRDRPEDSWTLAGFTASGGYEALRKALIPVYPELQDMRLVDFKVRILDSAGGTAATTRVMIESADGQGRRWSTIGVSPNIVDASYNALYDAITYKLFKEGAKVPG